jgi:hypothetical protein
MKWLPVFVLIVGIVAYTAVGIMPRVIDYYQKQKLAAQRLEQCLERHKNDPIVCAVSGAGPKPSSTLLYIRGVVSITLLSSSLYIILSRRYMPQDRHWAYATIGTVLGYWLSG